MGIDESTSNKSHHHHGFGYKEKRLSKSLFDFLYIIGRGGFGKVWKVRYKKTRQKYALKEMSKVKIIDRKSERSIRGERDFLSQLHHPYIYINIILVS